MPGATSARLLPLLLLAASATAAFASDERPLYDKAIEHAAIEKLQERLPALRAGLSLEKGSVRVESWPAPRTDLSGLADPALPGFDAPTDGS